MMGAVSLCEGRRQECHFRRSQIVRVRSRCESFLVMIEVQVTESTEEVDVVLATIPGSRDARSEQHLQV